MVGRNCLVKVMACVVPIYTMSCVKFPKKLCNKINAEIANF